MSRRPHHVQRRRWILWGPLAVLGLVILMWQATLWTPSPILIVVGILLCIPWVGDTHA